MKIFHTLQILTTVAILASGCSSPRIDTQTDGIDLRVIDKGIEDIKTDRTSWQTVLQRVATELPQDIPAELRQDVQRLATRSIAEPGVAFKCNDEFLGQWAMQSLLHSKRKCSNPTIQPLPPSFCKVSHSIIYLAAKPSNWSTLTYHGVDLDQRDSSGSLLGFVLVGPDGKTTKIDENRITRTSHYQLTVNLEGLGKTLYTGNIAKIRASWEEFPGRLPEINVSPWKPKTSTVPLRSGHTKYTPQHTGKGDKDFNTHDDEYMTVYCEAQSRLANSNTIETRVSMQAKEERPDWTAVSGSSPWTKYYTAPDGWEIRSWSPNSNSTLKSTITKKGTVTFTPRSEGIVSRFEVNGDQVGDEAGTWTSVTVAWKPMRVTIQEKVPEWLK